MDSAVSSLLNVRQAALQVRIATAVAGKQLDSAESQGQALVQMLQSAAQVGQHPDLGRSFDAVG